MIAISGNKNELENFAQEYLDCPYLIRNTDQCLRDMYNHECGKCKLENERDFLFEITED